MCIEAITPETAARLFAALNHAPAEPDCKFEGVSTERTRLQAAWSKGGQLLPAIRVVPRPCAPAGGRVVGPFVIDVPLDIERACPSVVPFIAVFVEQAGGEDAAAESGSIADPLFRATRAVFLGILLVVVLLSARGLAAPSLIRSPWTILAMTGFAAALALRTALPFSLSNWYSEVLPAAGPPPWMRFGPGIFAFQSLLRDAGIWSARTLVISQLLLGAAAAPLLVAVLRELRVGLYVTAAALVLLVVAPFHAAVSATTSEHVLASTLCLALLLSWLRAARGGDVVWLLLSVLLFIAVCTTRVDMAAQASLVLPWPFLLDRVERDARRLQGRSLWRRAGIMSLVAATTVAIVFWRVAIPSHHPMPNSAWRLGALRDVLPQFWTLSTQAPGWISLSAVLLALLGVVRMTVRRPLLLVRVAATVLLAFVLLGRTFSGDELLAARYFLFTIPIFLIASGFGFEALLALLPQRYRARAAALGVILLGVSTGLAARPAYTFRYAFQDEYSFARSALALLPDGCIVYQVGIRAAELPRDLDCCLDVHRSPLVLDFPKLRFLTLPEDPASVLHDSGCSAYYESIACAIIDYPDDPSVHSTAEKAAEYFGGRCAQVRRLGRFELLAETTVSPHATVNFFQGKRPRVALYRWTE